MLLPETVDSSTAHQALQSDPRAVLVDCRTEEEWRIVGIPDHPRTVFVEFIRDGQTNPRFFAQLADAGVTPDHPVYFICRSGNRSQLAAMLAANQGYKEVYNVVDGFEGGFAGNGWALNGLPWKKP